MLQRKCGIKSRIAAQVCIEIRSGLNNVVLNLSSLLLNINNVLINDAGTCLDYTASVVDELINMEHLE